MEIDHSNLSRNHFTKYPVNYPQPVHCLFYRCQKMENI